LDAFVLGPIGFPFWATVLSSIFLIWIYTFRGGIKTVVWTDTLQTAAMLLAAGITIWVIKDKMGMGLGEMVGAISDSGYAKIFDWDPASGGFFVKQFLTGMFIAIVMTGLDQDMMQKNLTCKTLKEAQKNMETFSVVLVFVNIAFLALGALLYMYGTQAGAISVVDGDLFLSDGAGGMIEAGTDQLFPHLALNYLPPAIGIFFIVGLIAAAYSSADSALTALTTSFCVDILDFEKRQDDESRRKQTRMLVHVGFSLVLFATILVFHLINDDAVISSIFTAAGYTYGPLLGLYAFGMLTKFRPVDSLVPVVCIVSPILCFGINELTAGWFGFSILLVNGAVTFLGLLLLHFINPDKDATTTIDLKQS
ncbi:MAG: sodium:solute symporter, partial [Bacteroidota bacterium]